MSGKKARAKPIVFRKKLADKLLKQYPAVGKMVSKEDVLDLLRKEVIKQKKLKEQKRSKK